MSNQTKYTNAIVSADTFNYFDRVAHLIVGIIFQYFRLVPEFTLTFFTRIKEIKMYLLTSYRVLNC